MSKRLLIVIFTCCTLLMGACKPTSPEVPNASAPSKKTVPVDRPHKQLPRQPKINVFVENSGSMDGFVKPSETEFKNTLHDFLSRIHSDDVADSMWLCYINSEICYRKHADSWKEIDKFTKELTINSFKTNGGSRKSTIFANLFDNILQHTPEGTVSILVSDCISDENLQTMKSNIRSIFSEHFNYRLAVGVMQFYSQFDGIYYCGNYHQKISGQRPYYVWIIGDRKYVSQLMDIEVDKAANSFTMIPGGQKVDYCVQPASGSFKLDDDDPKTTITKWKKDKITDKSNFAMQANFNNLLQTDDYLADVHNYKLSDPDFTLTVTKSPVKDFTHRLMITSRNPKKTTLVIRLKMDVPAWVKTSDDSEGDDMSTAAAMSKTYGILPMVQGIFDAFTAKSDDYTSMKITIK